MRWLTGDWELKAVALVLAVALWIYTSGQARVDRLVTVEVPLAAVVGLPDGVELSKVVPETFTVQLSVPTSRLPELRTETLVPRIDLRREPHAAGPVSFPLTSLLLGLPNDIRILATEPPGVRTITVVLDQVVEDHLAVAVPVTRLREGLDAVVRLERTRVRVRAPERAMASLRANGATVQFNDIDLTDLDPASAPGREERLVLTPRPGPWTVIEPVTAIVQIRAAEAVRQVFSLPVHLVVPRTFPGRFIVELSQEQVAVTVRGPAALLRTLRTEDLLAEIRIPAGTEPGTALDLPVEVRGPAWMAHEPVRVRATLRPAVGR